MSQNLYYAFFCIFLQSVVFVHGTRTGLYSIIAPGTIRSNFKYNVAVSLHKAYGPCRMKICIIGPSYNDSKTVNVQPMSSKNVEFHIPKLAIGDYNLTAVGLTGIHFENTTSLNFADYKPSIYVQTDKATYKPGDLVQFRVVCLDANTRPAKVDKPITILINDGAQNRINQITNVELTKGVYTGNFQLSEQPVLGIWNIEVNIGGEEPEVKIFEVAKYVLPKFEVSIETAKDVAIPDGKIKITIRSQYTYGKSVKGKATVSVKPAFQYYGGSNMNLEAEKTIDVDGKGYVEFDLTKDLHLSSDQTYVPPLNILAIMEEELTGNKQNATAQVQLYAERYRIEGIDTPYTYQPGKPVQFKVVVKNIDGSPVQDTKNKIKLIVDSQGFYREIPTIAGQPVPTNPEHKTVEYEMNLDEHGMATFEFVLPENNSSFFSIRCKFLDTTVYLSSLSKFTPTIDTPELLTLSVNTKKPQLGKDVSVVIKSSEVIPYFVYTIVGRGNILKMAHVDVPKGRKVHTIKFKPTFEMIPKASIFVHYICDNNLRFEGLTINFEKDFENSIDITTQVQAKPGEEVKLKINTNANSFVGLLGVDQSVLLLKSGNDFDKDTIFNDLSKFDTNTPLLRGYGNYPGQTSGLVTMTNANYPYNDGFIFPLYRPMEIAFEAAGIPGLPLPSPPRELTPTPDQMPIVRKEFPENWIFYNEKNTEVDGFTLTKKIPDTITSWVITGFSLNAETGFALTSSPTKIRVFQPFFVSTNLPYSVKRREVIAIPVIIFNYMDKTLDAEITMDNADNEYEFAEATNEVEEKSIEEAKRIKRVTIPSNSGKSVSFMIRPKKVGDISLKITAVTPLAGDAIQQMLKVEPEGVTQFANRAVFVNLKDDAELSETISIDIPPEVVPYSEYIEFSVVGDILGPTIQNLDKLVRMPYGCGEQNMVNFVPNILVLKYLEATNQNMPSITEQAKKFLEIGYQRELTYKHDDGSYSAFGKSDKSGSTWLTAYVVRSFHQAVKYTDIDPKVIVEGLDFLAAQQADNGSFPEVGKLFDSAHQNELGLTAFVLLAFLENVEHIPKYQAKINNGMKYLLENVDKSDDQYSLAIAALALQLGRDPAADKILAKLETLAHQENGLKWWSKEEPKKDDQPASYSRPRSNDVEITSYILLALLENDSADTVLPIIKWLISQRNSNGGFSSTQDTVVGLQALIKFAEKTGSGTGQMEIDFISNGCGKRNGSIKVNPENALVLQTHVLHRTARQVEFTAKGKGSCMVQLSYRYNLAEKDKQPSFQIKTNVKENTTPQQLIVEVCVEYIPRDEGAAKEKKESNMAVLEVALPSGYTADAESFANIESVDRVKRCETKNSDSTVIVYFDSLTAGDIKCVPVEASKTHAVAKQKPAAVTIYDYYDTAQRATEYYEVKSSLCDICEGDDCGSGCKKE